MWLLGGSLNLDKFNALINVFDTGYILSRQLSGQVLFNRKEIV